MTSEDETEGKALCGLLEFKDYLGFALGKETSGPQSTGFGDLKTRPL